MAPDKLRRRQSVRAVGLGGVEPPTSRLSGVRSNHLSYSPEMLPEEQSLDGRSREQTTLRPQRTRSLNIPTSSIEKVGERMNPILKERSIASPVGCDDESSRQEEESAL